MNERFMNLGLLWLRALAGIGMAYHGYGKIFGGNMEAFAQGVAKMGFVFPEIFAWAAALAEFLGGCFLVIGFGTRYAALFIFITMSVAAFITHAEDPISVKELALCYWAMSGALILTGPGSASIDGK